MMDAEAGAETNDVAIVADENGFEVAVIGMAGRFPGAANIDQFWNNLCNGVESISTFTDEELLASGIDPNLLRSPDFVKAAGAMEGSDMFDAAFFRYSPREAETMAPQHRLMLECAWQALEHAGCDAQRYPGAIGVFAGESSFSYVRLLEKSGDVNRFGRMQVGIGNDRDFLSTTVSYRLDLSGPSMTIQTACSTSLSAVHMAYQSLLSGECDIALAGGVAISIPPKMGYVYEKEGIMSPDGHCRAFDASAQGTVSGEGVGIVALKRLEDARADGDCIHAIIKGSAMNNDGSRKVGFTAPSAERQADVIGRAQAMAEVEPDTLGYIEAHGTGTLLGDPIEISALTRAFRGRGSEGRQYCAIGSVKTNIGHLDAAAGIAGLIKTVLVLEHRQIPPSLHYRKPNPQIDFANSPFYVARELADWRPGRLPFRAGVSSFGIGGTNVHVVLEAAPGARVQEKGSRSAQLLLLSATTDTALDRVCADLAAHLKANPDLSLADVAFTLQTGRQQFQQRRMLVCDDVDDAIATLETCDPKRVQGGNSAEQRRSVVFMFPGQGSQYVDMGRELYASEPGFRFHFDECCALLEPEIGANLRDLIYPVTADDGEAARRIDQTSITQPALFALEYSLARLWMSWGVEPRAMIGHSIGEYVAACLAGVFSLADALKLVCARAALMQSMEPGSMAMVPMPADEVRKLLGDGLSVAAINEPSMCVVSGPTEELAELETGLARRNMECRRLHTSHAFHSGMMEAVIQPFEELVRGIEIGEPEIPYVSNLTGTWVEAQEIADPAYWGRHLRNTVQFAAGLDKLFENPLSVFLEVGPGQTLSTLVRRNPSKGADHRVVASMRHPQNQSSDVNVLLNALGRLWLEGVDVDWAGFYHDQPRRRLPLPGYPFERRRFWIEEQGAVGGQRPVAADVGKVSDPGRWFYAPGWKSALAPLPHTSQRVGDGALLIFSDSGDLAERLVDSCKGNEPALVLVNPGDEFRRVDGDRFTLRPRKSEDMAALVTELLNRETTPSRVLYLWSMTDAADHTGDGAAREAMSDFYNLLYLVQAMAQHMPFVPVELVVVTSGAQAVTGDETLYPQRAAVQALCRVIPQEQDRIRCRIVDIEIPRQPTARDRLLEQLATEIDRGASDPVVALRRGRRWIQAYEPLFIDKNPAQPNLRDRGVYLITGGFGKIGMCLARYLAETAAARLVLIGRSDFPPRDSWDEQLAALAEDSALAVRIRELRALEEAGADVLALRADVADESQMRTVVDLAMDRFGQIDGVIHAAAATEERSYQLLRDLDSEACELQFAPKFRGLQVLDKVLEGQSPDFCVVMSSVASVLGGLRFAAYAAANAVVDACAQDRWCADGSLPWRSINWDAWQFGDTRTGTGSAVASAAMTAEEGIDAFARIISLPAVPQLVVSTSDLHTRLKQWAKPLDASDADNPDPAAAPDSNRQQPALAKIDFTREGIEGCLIEIWTELLGVDGIDPDDNLFELGGDSLFALQVTSRLRESLIADLSVATVLAAPTIAELSERVLEQHRSSGDDDRESEILQKIRNISPEEKKQLLAEARRSQGIVE